ncbi:MAG TPA: PxKF domain-containing protein, partial [Marmoricola sp.]|nr:PxKF domain-containing protein [Marmoricola sp.]
AADADPPTASPTQAPAANADGWNNTDVTVTWNWTDPAGGSGIDPAACTTASTSSGQGAAIDVTATCADYAGNVGTASYTVKVDTTAPATTITLTPTAPDGANDWYVSTVTVGVSATDGLSSVAQTRCVLDPASVPTAFTDLPDTACSIGTVSADGQHHVYAASIDRAGNAGTPVVQAIDVDRTAPVLDPSLDPETVFVGQTGVTASANATDATSGVATESCGGIDTSTAGVHSVLCTATDYAGNTATKSLQYVVQYRILGFYSPIPGSKWLAGQTVPVKIALGDANGVRISDAEAAALAGGCRVTFSVTGAQSQSAQCLRYDAANDQFVFNWKVGKQPLGLATLTVAVSYPGSTMTTTLSDQITIAKK